MVDSFTKLQAAFEEKGVEAFDELRENDPETYALVMTEAAMLVEEDEPEEKPPTCRLKVYCQEGESKEEASARSMIEPQFQAAMTVATMSQIAGFGITDVTELAVQLEAQSKELSDGNLERLEAVLSAQVVTLNAIFNALVQRSALNMGQFTETADKYMKLALKAQSQCAATAAKLAELKRPVIKQTNIAHGHQQVNNIENVKNELLEESNERVDTGATQETVGANPQLEAVGEIDGAKVA